MNKLVELMDAWLHAKYSHEDLILDDYPGWPGKRDEETTRKDLAHETKTSSNHYQKILEEQRKAKDDIEFLESLKEKNMINWKKARKNKVCHSEYSLNIKHHASNLF